ncbi:MAG: L,D-transpeptidase family protein [Burkholderiales bacterium]|nr:L,D-transpeptidase family protein [Burkholderiales bacterium]
MSASTRFHGSAGTRRKAAVAAALCAALAAGAAAQQPPRSASEDVENALVGIFKSIESHRLSEALARTEALIAARPNYRLAHLIKGDLLLARAHPVRTMGAAPNAPPERVRELREEALVRLAAYRQRPPKDAIPRYLLQMRPDQRHAVVVDTRKARLYVYQNDNGKPRFVADYYISHGKMGAEKFREGDQKTPLGVYHVTASLPKAKLADLYGDGAFPINYPNDWDRRNGRGGSGIWLHGTPSDTFARAPRASDGCVVLSNQDLRSVAGLIQVGLTPVIISEEVEWLSLDDWNNERRALLGAIENWRRDWESRDSDAYLSHYAKGFKGDGMNLKQWSERKRQVNAGKAWIKVALTNVSMFRYPGKSEMVVVTFDQEYKSSNLANTMRKRTYWQKEDGRWKIVDEGAA